MKNSKPLIALLVLGLTISAACSGGKSKKTSFADSSSWNTQQLTQAAREAAHASMKAGDRSDAKKFAEEGIEFAERCLMQSPEDPGCYYWHAVNTGLYYKIHIIGYQKGIKRMISDCEKVIEFNEKYDHAGAYRMLGSIYMQLPQTAGRPDSVVQDLDLAEEYLTKAVRISPDYPENHLALAEVSFKQDKFTTALKSLVEAKNLAPQWRTDVSYGEWKKTTLALERKIARSGE